MSRAHLEGSVSGKDQCIKNPNEKTYTKQEIEKLVDDYNRQNRSIDRQQRKWLNPEEYLQRKKDRKQWLSPKRNQSKK